MAMPDAVKRGRGVWLIAHFLEFWRARLARACELAQEPMGTPWLWSARARIYRFLLSRYGEEAGVHPAPPRGLRARGRVIVFDVEAAEAPPRARQNLAALFGSIRGRTWRRVRG